MAEGQIEGPDKRSRAYTKILLTVVGTVALSDLLSLGLGFLEWSAFQDWAKGAFMALLGALAWEVVERRTKQDGKLRAIAWFAFPLAILLAFASLPFLAMSVYPPLKDSLTSSGRVEARILETTGILEIFFPRPVIQRDINLKLGSVDVTTDSVKENPDAFQWKSPRTLAVDWRRLLKGSSPPSLTVGVNMIPRAPRFRYETHEEVPPQRVPVRDESIAR